MKVTGYKPWNSQITSPAMDMIRQNKLYVLDLEMSAICNLASCIYCDSKVGRPRKGELTYEECEKLIIDGSSLGLKWIFVCGLGEPLADPKFLKLVNFASRFGIRFSFFTNGIIINQEIAQILKKAEACLILKLDSFNSSNFDQILGRKGASEKIYNSLHVLINNGFGEVDDAGQTALALSIVPTKITANDVLYVVEYCCENGLFPSIGELEYAGKGRANYETLGLSCEDLISLKNEVEKIWGGNYMRPLCPAVIGGLHVDNMGNCTVHRLTGVSCEWFLLSDPDMVRIGNIRENSINELLTSLNAYRSQRFYEELSGCQNVVPNVFGGCGGRIEIIKEFMNKIR
jgi:MoaA/NifB/PqqE/SkfB family radical SAM enzyme